MDYDFLIIGGGSAGYAAARTAVGLGLRTAVVEGGSELGGLCILRGCMPSKTLIESANRFHSIRRAKEFGLRAAEPTFHGEEIIARKRRLIEEFASERRDQLQSGNFDLRRGSARFVDAETVQVTATDGDIATVRARAFLIATGSAINKPAVPGLEDCLTSDDVLDLAEIPESVVVLGAGPVSLELAHYFNALGRRVTIVQRSPQILHVMDADVAGAIREAFLRKGIEIFAGTKLTRIVSSNGAFQVSFDYQGSERTIEASAVLNALGRKPNVEGLALDTAGVKLENGAIAAKTTQQTANAKVFAAGDCCGPYEVVHVAVEQGELAARNAARVMAGETVLEEMDYRLNLFVVFTEPQAACVGLTESAARKRQIPFLRASHPFNDHGKSLVMGETDGFVKLLADPATREILGGAVVGPHASDLIHEIVVAMRFRATAGQLATVPHYHPTLSEIWTYPAAELAETTAEVGSQKSEGGTLGCSSPVSNSHSASSARAAS